MKLKSRDSVEIDMNQFGPGASRLLVAGAFSAASLATDSGRHSESMNVNVGVGSGS